MRLRISLFLTMVALAGELRAQDQTPAEVDTVASDIYRFGDGIIYTYTQPVRWKKKDWIALGGLLASTALVTLVDEPFKQAMTRVNTNIPGEIERIGYHYGKPYSAFVFTGALYLGGLIFNDRWAKDTGLQLGVTLLTSGLLQTGFKYVIGRARPGTEGAGVYDFKPFSDQAAYHSFLSGHAAVAFGISFVMVQRLDNVFADIFFYSLAAGTAISRLQTNAHWLSDIWFGAGLAWFCAKTATKRLSINAVKRRENDRISWHVVPNPAGVSLVGKF